MPEGNFEGPPIDLVAGVNPWGEISQEMAEAGAKSIVEEAEAHRMRKLISAPAKITETIRKGLPLEIRRPTDPVETGLNGVYVVKIEGFDGEYIFKPDDEAINQVFTEIPKNSYGKREAAAYVVDRALGLNVVPETVYREVEGRTGSCQKKIKDHGEYTKRELNFEKDIADRENIYGVFLLDLAILSVDRNIGNILREQSADGQPVRAVAIDNSIAFGPLYHHSELDYYRTKMPKRYVDKFSEFVADKERVDKLTEGLKDYLSAKEIEACVNRIKYVAKYLTGVGRVTNGVSFNPDLNEPIKD